MTKTLSVIESLELVARASVALTEDALQLAGDRSVSLQQWRALLLVADMDDGVRISAVARRVDVTVPATGRLLHRLATRNLVRLEPDPDGSGAQVARLTPDGRALVEDAVARRRRVLEDVAQRLQEPEAGPVLAELALLMHDLAFDSAISEP